MGVSLTLAAWLTVHWGLLPRLEQWRPQIEARASAALGQPVRIGSIEGSSHGWVPALEMKDVRLLDAEGRTALQLGRVQAALSPSALWTLQLRFSQLHLDGVQLDVRRDLQGRIRVAGLDTQASAGADDDGRAADWLFSQPEIVIRRGTVRWTDERRAAPPLELGAVDLVLRNGLRRHQIRLDATPPPDWGERFSLIGQFTQSLLQRRGDWRQWSGTVYGNLPSGDVSRLRQYVALPFELSDGRGALRVWLDWERGQWREAAVDLALADVNARLAPQLQPLAMSIVTGRLTAARQADGVQMAVRQLRAVTPEGLEWPVGDLALEWRQKQELLTAWGAAAAPVTSGRLRAERLDLGMLGVMATRLPLGRAMEATLKSLAPAGVLAGLDLRWTGTPDAPQRWQAQGKVTRLVLAPQASAQAGGVGRPGLAGADIEFDISESGGKANLAMQQGALHFPGILEEASIAMDQLDAKLDWRVRHGATAGVPPAIELRISEARFANADGQGSLQAQWRTGKAPGFGPGAYLPGEVDLTGRLVKARAERVAAYLPLGLPASVRHWVGRAVRGGQIDNGSFVVKGDAWLVPFAGRKDGTFRIAGRLSDGQFDYLPSVPPGSSEPAWVSPWPGLTQVSGELVFDRATLLLDKAQARLWGVQLRNVQARIDELGHAAVLRIAGEGRGPVSDLLRFVDVSPVGQWLGGALKDITGAGAGDLKLELGIPLQQPEKTTVAGSVTLPGNDVQIRPELPLLAQARGRVDFTHRSFQVVGATARALGGEVAFDGGSQPDGNLAFQAQGTATAEGLRRAIEFAPLPSVASALRGQAAWRAQLNFIQGRPELTVTSDLVGMHSDWPAPLDKVATTALPLRWQTRLLPQPTRPGELPRDQLRLDLGTLVQLRMQRELGPDSTRILSGSLGLGEAATTAAAPGQLAVRGRLARLDADAWRRSLDRLGKAAGDVPPLPRLQVALQVQELLLASRRLTQAAIELQQESVTVDGSWLAQVTADQLAGRLSWRAPRGPLDAGRVTARLDRLALPPEESLKVEPLLESPTTRLPALDIVVDEFEMRGRKLGRLSLQAAERGGASGREWRLEQLELSLPEARLSAKGQWLAPERAGGVGRMSLDLGVVLEDSGRLATRFGWVDTVRGGKGELKGNLAWNGSPLSPDLASMDGNLSLNLAQGQFLKAEPGLGRLMGIVSLQSLPRRLLLDFRDVFQQGFAFDQFGGDVSIARGRAQTSNLRMRGVQAAVLIEGSADLVRETQDLRVLIVPEINAGAASLAYAAINPAIGLGTFLAQMLLRDPLRAANTREFVVTGPMADPKVERVERALTAPLPAVPPALPAPAAPAAPAPASAPRATGPTVQSPPSPSSAERPG